MKVNWLILIMSWMLFPVLTVNAAPTSTMIKVNHISDEALQMVKLHRYNDAEKLLESFTDEFFPQVEKEKILSNDQMRILTLSYHEAAEALARQEIPHDEKLSRVTKFRLVIDALSSGTQPMWTEMEEPIMSVFRDVKEAAYTGNNINFHSNFNSFLSLYNMIYPSLKIDIPEQQIQALDAKVSYIDQYRPKVLSKADDQQELEVIGSELQSIFDEMTDDETDPSLWWVIISTGGIIILTLSYVGWRKYKGNQEREKSYSKK